MTDHLRLYANYIETDNLYIDDYFENTDRLGDLRWSQEIGQLVKVYSTV